MYDEEIPEFVSDVNANIADSLSFGMDETIETDDSFDLE